MREAQKIGPVTKDGYYFFLLDQLLKCVKGSLIIFGIGDQLIPGGGANDFGNVVRGEGQKIGRIRGMGVGDFFFFT